MMRAAWQGTRACQAKFFNEVFIVNKFMGLVASAFLVAVPLVSYAASDVGPVKGDQSFTISGSGNSDKDFDNNAYGLSGEWGYYLTDKWLAGVRQSLNGSDLENAGNSWSGATRGFIQYNFLDGKYRPYLGVNLGGIYGESVSETGAAGIEGGVKVYVLEKTFINVGMEYSFLFEDTDDFDNSSNDGLWLYNVGVGFNF
jgi:hypothetical protein